MRDIKTSKLDEDNYKMLMRASRKYDLYIKTNRVYHHAVDITKSHLKAYNIAFNFLSMETNGQANVYYDRKDTV